MIFLHFRLRVEAPAGPRDARFLHVLQGVDAGANADSVMLVHSASGTHFSAAVVIEQAILFPVDLDSAFTALTYTVPAGTNHHLITGLKPGFGYDVVAQTVENNMTGTISELVQSRFHLDSLTPPPSAKSVDVFGTLVIKKRRRL